MDIKKCVERQQTFFRTGRTIPVDTRIRMMKKLRNTILIYEKDIERALKEDLGKSEYEAYMCEIGLTLAELSYQISHIKKWTRVKCCKTELINFPAKSFTVAEPYGVVLIMSPWNYPFMLTMEPLIGALAAGNCCILKPSAYAPATSAVIRHIIEETFPSKYVTVIEGGRKANRELLDQSFDYIFFTGGVQVGKTVLEKAARNLTPVTLELGGKSPCIIDKTCNLKVAAKRLAFGKYLNCGQTCVAPDYVLIDAKVKKEFVKLLKLQIVKMYGSDPLLNDNYGKIINRKHFDRIISLIDADKVIWGGRSNPDTLQIEPTIMDAATPEDAVMQEEIFGPVMPLITYHTLNEAENFIAAREKPLALYLFTKDRKAEQRFLKYISFGGGCVNDTIMHLTTPEMGFGGVGHSGMGSYHGKKSFETFSHQKSVLKKANWLDLPVRYQPYRRLDSKLIKKLLC